MNNCASDFLINSIKTLIDNCRCVNCDHLNQVRHRFSCGHSICEVCIETSNTCMLCSPSSNATPVIDKPQTDRVQHASELLNSFQSLFDIDVYRKQRISEKLKVEKEIFPKCIQAPIKYYNKRKSSIFIDKENIETFLPGENIFPYERVKMENSKTYVNQWLNQNQNNFAKDKKARLPFTDLSINSCKSKNLNNKDKSISKKRKLNKTVCTTPTSIYKPQCKENRGYGLRKCNNHESGIELDDDICFINDSQSEILYKDKLAQIAVLEADKKSYSFMGDSLYVSKDTINHIKPNKSLNLRNEHIENVPITSTFMSTSPYKVPFYKKSKLFESCQLCATYIDEKFTNEIKMKNVTVTIDNPSFITTIQIFEDPKHVPEYKSIGIQTEKIGVNLDQSKPTTDMDLFQKNIRDTGNVPNHEHAIQNSCQIINKPKGIVIEDSDCDSSDNEASAKLEVMADIHRACKYEDYVFRQLNSYEYGNRVIPRVRGKTPASSDSSDKENYNPNRKKQKLNSKCKKK